MFIQLFKFLKEQFFRIINRTIKILKYGLEYWYTAVKLTK